MSQPIIQPQAQDDLSEIVAYLGRRNRDAARGTYDSIMDRIWLQAQSPMAGRLRDEILQELRSVAVGSYVVFFRPVQDTIEVLRVLHASRDHKKILLEQTEI